MGFFSDVLDTVGTTLGFSSGNPEQYNVDPNAYSEFYEQAMKDIYNIGNDPASQQMRQGIQGAAQSQLEGLANNSAQRKQQFGEDMNRSFAGQTQELARSKGGTGTLAQALRPSGAMADANARATARGYTDLYSQGVKDLGSIQGIQGSLYNQDLQKGQMSANAQLGQQDLRMGQATTNANNMYNAKQAQYDRLGGTLKGAGQMAGGIAAPHTFVGKAFGGG